MSGGGWTDLAATPEPHGAVEADLCVIGAGAAGIYLSSRFVQQGHSVVLLEAGPDTGVDSRSVGFDAVFAGDPYPGATAGRFFGLGGSTTRWGGALVPHTHFDIRDDDTSTRVWTRIVGAVASQGPAVLRVLGYEGEPDFEDFAERSLGPTARTLAASGIQAQAGLYLPFRRKNLVSLLGRGTNRPAGLRVFFNAVARTWIAQASHSDGARIQQLVAVSRNHNSLRVRAGKFIIAAGAIESARILLEINEADSQPVLRPTALPGDCLGDHLSMPVADVLPDSLAQTARLFAPRFCGAWMRGFRLLETDPPAEAPRAFAHFIFANRSRGFELAKTVLGAMQQRRIPHIRLADVANGIGDLARLGYGRFAKSRLYIPSGTSAHLQLDMEQTPARDHRVSLTDQKDDYGRRIARINWRISTHDLVALDAAARRFLARWPGAKAGLPELRPRMIAGFNDGDGAKPYDAYHPVGTCRMGEDAEAVVDDNLKVWGVDNLWLVSTGVLPSAGTANPTFTMLCLAHELVEHLRTVR